MGRYLKTNAVRLAALYFALFATSVLALLVFIYFSTADFAQRQTEATLDAESRGLAEQYAERGLAGLLEIIQDRSAPGHPERTLYLITDPLLHPLAGNLSQWPRATPDPPRLDRISGGGGGRRKQADAHRARLGLRPARRLPAAGRPRSARCDHVSRPHHPHPGLVGVADAGARHRRRRVHDPPHAAAHRRR